MKQTLFTVGAGLAALGIATGIVSDRVGAQTEATPEAGAEASIDVDGQQRWIDILAENLGLDVAVVEDAIQQTMIDMVEMRSDELIEAIENGDFPFLGGFEGGFGRGIDRGEPGRTERGGSVVIRGGEGPIHVIGIGPGTGIGMHGDGEAIAEFLGITVEELHESLMSGQRLDEVAAANGKSVEELKAYLMEQAEAAIDALLTPVEEEAPAAATPTTGGGDDLV